MNNYIDHEGWERGVGGYQNREAGGYWNPDYERQAMKETRRCFSRVGLVYLAYLVMVTLSQVAAAAILVKTGLIRYMGNEIYMLASILSMYPVAVPLIGLLTRWVPKKGSVGRETWNLGKLCGFFVVAMGALYMGNIIGNVFMAMVSRIKGEPIINELDTLVMSMEPWTLVMAVVIVAPIMEELVFRKFLLDRIAGYGHLTAMLVSAFLFGVAHGNFYQFFYAFALGMIFAYVYLHTGKIAYTIGFHMVINFWGSIIPLWLLKVIEHNMAIGSFMALGNLMLMAGFIICSIILMVLCRNDIFFCPAGDGLRGGKRAAAVWGNLGMILFCLFGLFYFGFSFQ